LKCPSKNFRSHEWSDASCALFTSIISVKFFYLSVSLCYFILSLFLSNCFLKKLSVFHIFTTHFLCILSFWTYVLFFICFSFFLFYFLCKLTTFSFSLCHFLPYVKRFLFSLFSFFPPLSTISFFFAEIIFVLSLEPPTATNIRNNDPSYFQWNYILNWWVKSCQKFTRTIISKFVSIKIYLTSF